MASTCSHLPPPVSHVFTAQGTSHINAPIDTVWDVLFDLEKYPEWNPFVRSLAFTEPSGRVLSREPAPGDRLVIRSNIPPNLSGNGQRQTTCTFFAFDKTNYKASWGQIDIPQFLLHTSRWSVLSETELVDGGKQTMYETQEAFAGPLAWIIKWFVGANVQKGFQAMADALKHRVESLPNRE
ncbi:hypothetical protein BKA62DRAFT_613522 [Auriculariales sp. MPI-PUGE-AT-0066]|nr:hypothetical protein BKA62DRAFT_613522 [Auriculariales sp. MPI-PUGE-AT-0066]